MAAPEGKVAYPMNVFAVMEDLNEKLKILNYEQSFCRPNGLRPLTRTYFAIAGKPSEQFPYFAMLTLWLLRESGAQFLQWSEYEDPQAICANMADALRGLGYSGDLSATSLRRGCGEAVVSVLDFLASRCLQRRGFRVQPPVYVSGELAEEAVGDDEPDEGDIKEDELADEEEEGLAAESVVVGGASRPAAGAPAQTLDDGLKGGLGAPIESTVAPEEWLLELERVGPRLKYKAELSSKDWHSHLDQSVKHDKALGELFPEIKQQLDRIASQLKQALEKVSSKERHLNREFEHLGAEFREHQKDLEAAQEECNKLQEALQEAQAELQAKTEAVEAAKAQMNERNSTMTDNTPVKRIIAAITELKKQVMDLDMRIGIVGQTLLHAKVKYHHLQLQQAASKAGAPGAEKRVRIGAAAGIQADSSSSSSDDDDDYDLED